MENPRNVPLQFISLVTFCMVTELLNEWKRISFVLPAKHSCLLYFELLVIEGEFHYLSVNLWSLDYTSIALYA